MAVPIPVSTGFSWTSGLMLVANLLLSGVLVALIRSRPALKKIAADREANLLTERAEEMEAMRERLAKLEAERAVDRHRLNNVTQCLDALLLLLETAPEKAAQHVSRIKEMRATQMKAEAAEKGAIAAATLKDKEKVE